MKIEKVEIKMIEKTGSFYVINIKNASDYQLETDKIKSFLAGFEVFADNIADLNIIYFTDDNSFRSFYLTNLTTVPVAIAPVTT